MIPYSAVGHATLTDRGVIVAPDAGCCTLLDIPADKLIGRGILEFTAPDYRPACSGGMAALRATGQPFVVTKQMVRGDGTRIWVAQTTAISTIFAAPAVLATFVGICVPESQRDPRALLANARFLAESRIERDQLFGKMLRATPCWDLLLVAYIAEAEGGTADAAALAAAVDLDGAVSGRWVRAMTTEGLFEVENGDAPPSERRYRLSASAHDAFERFLTRRLTRLGGFGLSAARWTPAEQ